MLVLISYPVCIVFNNLIPFCVDSFHPERSMTILGSLSICVPACLSICLSFSVHVSLCLSIYFLSLYPLTSLSPFFLSPSPPSLSVLYIVLLSFTVSLSLWIWWLVYACAELRIESYVDPHLHSQILPPIFNFCPSPHPFLSHCISLLLSIYAY